MAYSVSGHRLALDGVRVAQKPTPNKSGVITPEVLVLHDTAGRIEGSGESSIEWLCNPTAGASAHLVLGRDGKVTQLAPFNVACWHAGRSSYKGRENVNAFSIGIEIVNPGSMGFIGGKAIPWWKQEFDVAEYGIERRKTPEHGDAWWMPYTPKQLEACRGIGRALVIEYGLKDVTTHWAIAPGRKVDTNPLFPLVAQRAFMLGGISSVPTPEVKEPKPGVLGTVTASSLNFRKSPMGEIVGTLPKGTSIEINSESNGWMHVTTPAGHAGYVSALYVQRQ
jgi:N-acetylmuramoyl-L-alanine amidase